MLSQHLGWSTSPCKWFHRLRGNQKANERNSLFFLTQPVAAPSANLHSGWLFKCFQTVMFYSIRLCLDISPPLRPIVFFANYTQNLVLVLWIRWLSFSCYWRVVEAVLWGELFQVMPECSLLVSFSTDFTCVCFFVPQIWKSRMWNTWIWFKCANVFCYLLYSSGSEADWSVNGKQ